ncbi:MAG TPA: M36 family metallopeptidase, partial [Pyrinomonadaceae bacterium]|nr:M36 family metallopeptidase [Pyrinomonadaceae bacterium]
MCAVVFDFGQTVSSQSPRKGGSLKAKPAAPNGSPALENFDIRIRTQAADAAETSDNQGAVSTGVQIETRKPLVANQSQRETAAAIVSSMNAAQESLAQRVPGLRVEYNETLRVPEVVDVNGLTLAAATGSTEETVRGFVSENAAAYGLTRSQAAKLKKFSDYTNPAGNLSFVELEQEINGVPVFQGYVRGILSADGRLVRTTGLLAPGLNSASVDTTPRISVTDAVAAGAKSINLKVKGTGTSLSVKEEGENGITKVVTGGPFDEDVKTSLVIFPLVPGTGRLAYAMTLWQPVYSYYVLIDATTGELLWRKCITAEQTVPVTYNIYNNDSPTPSAPIPGASNTIAPPVPQPPGITRTDVTLVSENPQDSLGWIPDSAGPNPVTTGNNVDAGLDISAPNGIDTNGRAQATNRVFRFDYKPDGSADPTGSNNPTDAQFRMGAVTNLFFWTNRYNDVLYNLGFTEAARNFQTNNFGRGGLGNDPVLAEAQDSSGTNNANFNTPPDGTPGRMQMYLWPGTVARDGDLDQEVVFHELTHGVSNRLHANGSGLNSDMAAGMGEGWGDFYGITMLALRSPDGDDGKRLYAFGAYDTRNYYRAIRRFPYAVKSALAANGKSHNPVTFADIDPAQADFSDAAFPQSAASANEVHNQGEIWCSMLIEVRAKLIERLGLEPGSTRVLQVVTDGMKFDPVNPTILNARNSIIGADCAGYNGVDERDIWEGFRIRGAGFRASTSGIHVTENFEGPNLKLLNVTSQVVGGGNNDGVVDPGETVR